MKYQIFIFITYFLALIGTRFSFTDGITYGDFACAILAVITLARYFSGEILPRKDMILRYTLGYAYIMAITSILNMTITETSFLNYFRIYVEGITVYAILQATFKNYKSIKWFTLLFILYATFFVVISRDTLSQSMLEVSNYALLDFGTDRNNWAFTNLLLIIAIIFFLLKRVHPYVKYSLVLFPVMVFYIYFSASRFSLISLGIFCIFLLYWMRKDISSYQIILFAALALFVYYALPYIMEGVDAGMLESSKDLLDGKISKSGEETLSYRLMELNIGYIERFLIEENPFVWIFGDGLTVTHGIFSHVFISTGIVGFVYFCSTHLIMIRKYLTKSNDTKYIAFIMFIMLLNDMITNARFISDVNFLIYMGMLSYLIAYDKIVYNENSHIS